MSPRLRVYLGPTSNSHLTDAIERAGGELVPLEDAEAAVWTSQDPQTWAKHDERGHLRWVQLLSAGVENWFDADVLDADRIWTSAAGAYARPVAEHALALLLALRRRFVESARTTRWEPLEGTSLRGSRTAIVGCGAIGRALIPMLASVESDVVAVTRSGSPVEGAIESHDPSTLTEIWPRVDAVVLAAPATDRTRHLIDAAVLDQLPSQAMLVNVARGSLVDTDALVAALTDGSIAGAGLDVTDPEPLPTGHPLWTMPNVLITPHVANPPSSLPLRLADRVAENVQRYITGQELLGIIDLEGRY
jgi:phosphoglycerate dehydrogenase-like enzyme